MAEFSTNASSLKLITKFICGPCFQNFSFTLFTINFAAFSLSYDRWIYVPSHWKEKGYKRRRKMIRWIKVLQRFCFELAKFFILIEKKNNILESAKVVWCYFNWQKENKESIVLILYPLENKLITQDAFFIVLCYSHKLFLNYVLGFISYLRRIDYATCMTKVCVRKKKNFIINEL